MRMNFVTIPSLYQMNSTEYLAHTSYQSAQCERKRKSFSLISRLNSYTTFMKMLHFLLPGLNRKLLIYWDSDFSKARVIDTKKLFLENECKCELDNSGDISNTAMHPTALKLPVEDEFFLVFMKLRMKLSNTDLAERFCEQYVCYYGQPHDLATQRCDIVKLA